MKERSIIFKAEEVRAILAGRKAQARRIVKPQPVAMLRFTNDGVLYADTSEWRHLDAYPKLAQRRLHGRLGRQGLLAHEVQGLWSQGLRGLVSVGRAHDDEGLRLDFNVTQEQEGHAPSASADLRGLSRSAAYKDTSGQALGRQSPEQLADQLEVGNTGRKLARPSGSRAGNKGGKAPSSQVLESRAESNSVGSIRRAMQPTTCGKSVGGFSIGNFRNLPWHRGLNLWVRETWMHSNWPDGPAEPDCAVFYRADYLDDPLGPDLERSPDGIRRKWLPSAQMPRWASRILLEVTGVRVERLQDISEADAQAEGATGQCPVGNLRIYNEAPLAYHFAQIWEQAHPNTWDQNPWVWVIEFRRVEP